MWGGVRVVFGVQRQVLLPLGTLDTCRASWLVPCSPIPAAGVGVGGLPILSKGEVVPPAVDLSHWLLPLLPGAGGRNVPWQLQRERAFG